MVGDGVLVDLGRGALQRPRGAGEVSEVISGQRDVGGQGLADRLPVLPGLGHGQHLAVGIDHVGDAVQDGGPLGQRGLSPGVLGGVGRIEGQLDVVGPRLRDRGEGLARGRALVLRVLARHWRNPVTPDEVLVAGLDLDDARRSTRCLIDARTRALLRRLFRYLCHVGASSSPVRRRSNCRTVVALD